MRRLLLSLTSAIAASVVSGFLCTLDASAQQSINFYVGGFTPRALDGRPSDDVLVRNLDTLEFNIKHLNGATFGGEWLVGLGDLFEGGLGIGFYTRSTPAVYRNFVNANGTEIDQDLKLRIVPFTATVRVLPLGRHSAFQPYIGAGVGVLGWRYSETGQFVDFADKSIFRDNFVGSGSATGPVILGGVRVSGDQVGVGGEIRYQSAEGTLPTSKGFAGTKVDLGGFNYLFTVNIRF